ncbi:MAG: zinc ribbon domain-containing protein [Mollicutes bacterium]|nr:zinc ribbon domain-containing protein [Mollicutes bacterium]
MKCPSCNKEIKGENSSFCPNCGFSLYGPRNVNLTDIYKDQNKEEKIEKITGFKLENLSNYDDLPISETESILNTNYKNPAEKKKFLRKEGFYSAIKKEKNKIIIISLSILTILFFLLWIITSATKKSCKCPKCEDSIAVKSDSSQYYSNNLLNVYIPSGYSYASFDRNIVLLKDDLSITIMPPVSGKLQLASIHRIEKIYFDNGYADATKEALEVDSRLVYAIKYSKDNVFYQDLYYQLSEGVILHTQLSSPDTNKVLVTSDIKKILSSVQSITTEQGQNRLSGFDRSLIISEFN